MAEPQCAVMTLSFFSLFFILVCVSGDKNCPPFSFVPCNCHKFITNSLLGGKCCLLLSNALGNLSVKYVFPLETPFCSPLSCSNLISLLSMLAASVTLELVFSIILELSSFRHLGCFSCFLDLFPWLTFSL